MISSSLVSSRLATSWVPNFASRARTGGSRARNRSLQRLPDGCGAAEDRLKQSQVDGQEDVLQDDDPQDDPRLDVSEPPGVDEQLGHDRR